MAITVRKVKKGDGKGIAESFNEGIKRGFNAYTGSNKLFSRKKINKIEKDIKGKERNYCCYVAVDSKTGKIVGSAIFFGKKEGRLSHKVEFGWGVHPDYARKGIATKMVEALLKEAKRRGFKRAEAEAAVENKGSVNLAKKVGFKIEGKRKCGLKLDNGKCIDTLLFGKILN
jgi:RimJ/RimL family protein N-acetyltransferase